MCSDVRVEAARDHLLLLPRRCSVGFMHASMSNGLFMLCFYLMVIASRLMVIRVRFLSDPPLVLYIYIYIYIYICVYVCMYVCMAWIMFLLQCLWLTMYR